MSQAFSPRRLGALVAKESRQIIRDPSTFLIAFLLPMMMLFLFGYALSLDNNNIRIAIVPLDNGPEAASLASAFTNSPYFDARIMPSVAAARPLMTDGRLRGVVVIPPDFSAASARGRPPAIQVITDGSQPNIASFVAANAEGVRAAWAANRADEGIRAAPPIDLSARVWFNPALTSRFMLVPGSIAVVMTMIGTLLTALVIAREWERGTMEAMLATPVRMTEFILSKVVPYFALAMISMVVCTLVAVILFQVPLRGSFFALALLTAAFLMPALGLGLFISSATRNQFVASQMALLASFLPTMLLSGFVFEISSMPAPIQAITYIVPARYFIPALQTVFLAGDIWALIWPSVGKLLLFGLFFFFLAFRSTRRTLDR